MTGTRNTGDQAWSADRAKGPTRWDGKTSFDDIYDQPDPRDYFRRLKPLRYQTPHHAQPIFRRLLAARSRAGDGREGPGPVLDVCCSYGINAALLNHDVTLDDLYGRYTAPQVTALPRDELIESDRAFYAERRLPTAVHVAGLDAARNAVAYAHAAGLLDEAFAEDLERAAPGPDLIRALAPVRLITVTGGVGYITSRTFGTLLRHIEGPVWVAAFVLRTVDYQPIADTLAGFGLVTEKAASRTFPQRRFTDEGEQERAIRALTAAGISPRGREADGFYHSELYVSRPEAYAAACPVADFLDPA